MKMKKVLALVLAFALTVTATVGGTVAYLTKDAGDEKNVFAVGNIDIELTEVVKVIGEGGAAEKIETGANYTGIMPGDYLKKEVTVANNGETPAYVAITVKLNNALEINNAIDVVYENAPYNYNEEQIQAIYDDVFAGWGLNYTKTDAEGKALGMRLTITGEDMPANVLHVDSVKTIDEYAQFYKGNWFGEQEDIIPFDGYYTKDMNKYELKYTYYAYLPAGESTTLFKGLNVPAEFNADQLAMFDGLVIDVEAKAIQADNMGIAEKYKDDENGKAKTAFEVLAGIINAEDLGVNNNPDAPRNVSSIEELEAVLTEGGIAVLEENISGEDFVIPANKNVVVELEGKELESASYIKNYGQAEISNGIIKSGTPSNYAVISEQGSKTIINNVDIKSAGGGIGAAGGAQVVFNSGSVDVSTASTSGRYNFYAVGEGTVITINGGDFSFSKTLNQKRAYIYASAGTTVKVNGGNFGPASTRSGYTTGILGEGTVIITGGTFGFDPSNWVADGYHAVKDGNLWIVSAI